MFTRILLIAAFLASAGVGSNAQVETVESPACNEEFARFLVDQQVSESRSVEQTDKRIRILIRAAEFLWKFEEGKARDHFTEAFKVASDRFREKGFEKNETNGLTTLLPDHRFEVIRAIAPKDGAWATRLIEQVLKEYEKDAADRPSDFNRTRELQDIMRVAEQSVKTNPGLSRALFRRAMAHPLDFHWFWALNSVAAEDRTFADALYVELLSNYSNSTPRRLLFLSGYPFASSRLIGPEKFQWGSSVPDGLTPNLDLQRRFIETFLRSVIAFASDPANLNLPAEQHRQPEAFYMTAALIEIEPVVVREFSFLIQQLSEAKAQANGMLTEQIRNRLADNEKRNAALGEGFEKRLKDVEEADSEGRLTDQMIIALLISGEKTKTEEQFRKIEPWLDKIREESSRIETVNYFWFLRAQLAVREYRIADAERFARKIPELEHRAVLFFQIAEVQLKNVSDTATAYQTLREVGRLAEQSETSVEKARVLLALANQYIKINPVFAMQELSDAIKVINRLENSNVMSTSVTRQIRSKTSVYFVVYNLPGQNLEGTFKAISKDNFEMSLSNAKSLEDRYLRTLAVLAVAQNCVDNVKKKPVQKKARG